MMLNLRRWSPHGTAKTSVVSTRPKIPVARLWELFRNSTQDRLAAYRATILAVDHAVGRYGWAHNLAGDEKAFAIRVLRNTLPDAALDFLDASVVISDDSVRYPPLLGTGGNIGRLDLVLNYAEHLALLLGLTDPQSEVLHPTLRSG